MKGFVTAKEAAHLIKNGDTVASAGMALMGLCEDVIRSTEARFLETGEPKNLTLFYGAHQGNNPITEYGWDHWAHEGMLKRWNGGFLGASPKIMELCNTNKIEPGVHGRPSSQKAAPRRARATVPGRLRRRKPTAGGSRPRVRPSQPAAAVRPYRRRPGNPGRPGCSSGS